MKKEFINEERIEGYIYSIGSNFNQLSERTSGENSKNPGTPYIAGDLDIAVDEDGLNVVTVHYTYVTPTYAKSGKPNSTYTTLKRIIDNPEKTWLTGGKENAFKVQCTKVSIGLNDFIAGDGKKVSAMRNQGGFCTIVDEFSKDAERNKFTADMLITKVTHIDADPEKNIKEDFTTVSGAIFGYGQNLPALLPVSFVVRNQLGMAYFEGLEPSYQAPVFTKVWGQINCKTVTTVKKEESAFGEAAVQTYERKSREYVITGTAKVPYDFGDEKVLTKEEVIAMDQARQIMLAEIEKRANENKVNQAVNGISFGAAMATSKSVQQAPVSIGDFNF